MPGLFELQLIKSIFAVSIWLSSVYSSISCSTPWTYFVSGTSAYCCIVIHLNTSYESIPICCVSLRWVARSTVFTCACLVLLQFLFVVFLLLQSYGIKFLVYFKIIQNCCLCSFSLYSPCQEKQLITCDIFILTFCELPNYFNHHAHCHLGHA